MEAPTVGAWTSPSHRELGQVLLLCFPIPALKIRVYPRPHPDWDSSGSSWGPRLIGAHLAFWDLLTDKDSLILPAYRIPVLTSKAKQGGHPGQKPQLTARLKSGQQNKLPPQTVPQCLPHHRQSPNLSDSLPVPEGVQGRRYRQIWASIRA